MKCVCITGAIQADLDRVLGILQQAGLKAPLAAKRDDNVHITGWHEQVLAARNENMIEEAEEGGAFAALEPVINPGRLWEQLASDIFVANIKAGGWGWADARSAWLLDFWANFEPNLNFILVYTTAERMLAQAMVAPQAPGNIDALMESWQAHHQQLLHFYHRNPGRCLLVDANEGIAHPAALMERCNDQWQLALTTSSASSNVPPAHPGALALYLATQIASHYPAALGLQCELDATAKSLVPIEQRNQGHNPANGVAAAPDDTAIINDYRVLRDRSTEEQLVATTQTQLALLTEQYELAISDFTQQRAEIGARLDKYSLENEYLLQQHHQLQQEREAQEKMGAEYQQQLAALTNEQGKTQLSLKEAAQENELLLLQLHQVQEELESIFLKSDATNKELAQLTPAKAALEKEKAALQAQRDQLTKARDEQTKLAADRQTQITQLTQARDQLTKAHDEQTKLAAERQQKIDALTKAKTTLEQEKTALSAKLNTQAENKVQAEALRKAELQIKEAAQENELLLLQLHQVQEELEHYFLQHQETQKQLKDAEQRLLLIQQHKPESSNNEAAEIIKVEESTNSFPATLRYDQVRLKREQVNPDYEHLWLRFENLSLGTARWPEFEFRLSCAHVRPQIFGNYPKLEFPEERSQAPFDSWFAEATDDFGAKLELRFAVPDSMDMAVWNRLSAHDQEFIKLLLAGLPAILATLQKAGIKLRRPWADWDKMVHEMQRLVVACTAPPAVEIPAPPPVITKSAGPAAKAKVHKGKSIITKGRNTTRGKVK